VTVIAFRSSIGLPGTQADFAAWASHASLMCEQAWARCTRARDARLGREAAIKELPAEFAADSERLHRFEQEARAAGTLSGLGTFRPGLWRSRWATLASPCQQAGLP